MTTLLKRAFDEAAKLPPAEQDALAKALLAGLESEKAWESAFANAEWPALSKLADEALEDNREGRTSELDPEKL